MFSKHLRSSLPAAFLLLLVTAAAIVPAPPGLERPAGGLGVGQ